MQHKDKRVAAAARAELSD